MNSPDPSDYGAHFSEDGFWKKLLAHPQLDFLDDVLALWFCLRDPATPTAAKATIVAALGYFICPFDLVPDLLPVVGWLDDAGVIAAALAVLRAVVTDEHRRQARDWLRGQG